MRTSKQIKISKRLETVAAYVPHGSRLADIGTDHGYIPIHLVLKGAIEHALAMDVKPGPLSRASTHIAQYQLGGQIETRLSDGLLQLHPGEADTIVIAGMGGELMLRLIDEGRHVWDSIRAWVLSPQSELCKVRHYLAAHGFMIADETMLAEDGKYYNVMLVRPGEMNYSRELDYLYGRVLIQQKHPVLIACLQKEVTQIEQIIQHLSGQKATDAIVRQEELKQTLMSLKEALHEMQ